MLASHLVSLLTELLMSSVTPCPGLVEGIPLRVEPGNRDPGEVTLRRLMAETKADEKALKTRVRMVLAGSYFNYYHRMLSWLLTALDFKCNHTAYRWLIMDCV
jgi:hypothetical protein